MLEPLSEMTKGVKVWNQLNIPGTAIGIEQTDVISAQRGSAIPDYFVVCEGEGVFDVKLQIVQLEGGHPVDKFE